MKYKIICPKCGTKLSRWHWMLSMMHYRCRSCQARFQMTFLGWLVTLGVILVEILWYVLFVVKLLPPYVAIGMVVATCIAAMVWLPYLTPVKPARNDEANVGRGTNKQGS